VDTVAPGAVPSSTSTIAAVASSGESETGTGTAAASLVISIASTGNNWLEQRALFLWYHHSAMVRFLSAQMTETKLIRKLAPKHFFSCQKLKFEIQI
jgi:hypothetical protein